MGASAFTVIILFAVVIGLGVLVYIQLLSKDAPSEQPGVGGDRDTNGCITSAGYSWCESKQKCQRVWEGPCPSNNEE